MPHVSADYRPRFSISSWFRALFARNRNAAPDFSGAPGAEPVADAEPTVSVTGLVEGTVQPEAEFRMLLISLMAAAIGLASGFVAYLLYNLIGFFTNVAFFQRASFSLASPWHRHLGPWVIAVPVIGGIIVGIMAKYGSAKIKGHGIPEAMEAVLVNRSKIEPKVAILKPLSAAIAIGTGGDRKSVV